MKIDLRPPKERERNQIEPEQQGILPESNFDILAFSEGEGEGGLVIKTGREALHVLWCLLKITTAMVTADSSVLQGKSPHSLF